MGSDSFGTNNRICEISEICLKDSFGAGNIYVI
jgi:hypothetical protein